MVLNDFKDTNQGGGTLTVSNSNMGERLEYNAQTKKYDVNVGDLENRLHALESKKINEVIPEHIDLGAGTVQGTSYTIDYGAFIEVNLQLEMPLAVLDSPPQKDWWSDSWGQDTKLLQAVSVGINQNGTTLYHKETAIVVTAAELGMDKIIAVTGIAGDLVGLRTETPWLVQDRLGTTTIRLGVHTLAELKQDKVIMFYQIKGTKKA